MSYLDALNHRMSVPAESHGREPLAGLSTVAHNRRMRAPASRIAQINNGVYRSGFATTQTAYHRAQAGLYAALDRVEALLQQHRFLTGDRRAPVL